MSPAKRPVFLLLLAATLSGCSVSKMIDAIELPSLPSFGGDLRERTGTGERIDTIAFADAYCRGDPAAALAEARALVAANPDNPRTRLLHGIALDLSGQGMEAYRVLEELSGQEHPSAASLKCGETFVYSGTVTGVAQRRLFSVRTGLEALGASLPPPDTNSAKAATAAFYALAAQAPARDPYTGAMTAQAALPPAPAVPAVAQPPQAAAKKPPAGAGSVLVHLGSYRTMKTLDTGWKTLRAKHANLLGGRDRSVTKIDLGKNRGQYLRLGVTVDDRAQAAGLCRRFKADGAYCAVLTPGKS